MTTGDDVFEQRVPTPEDLASMVKGLREDAKWTQVTLAELCNLT